MSIPTVSLSNGVQIPVLGLGTSHDGGFSHDAVVFALSQCGVRHLDTAQRYGCEEEVGGAIRESAVPRQEVFVTNKLWVQNYGYLDAIRTCRGSLSRMGLDYFDLFLLHWPESRPPGGSNRETRAETWRALEELYSQGVCRAIGVSNFLVHHLEQLEEDCSVTPHVNQVEFHPFQQPVSLMEHCRKGLILFEGYSPLAKGQALSHPAVQRIALKHQRSPAQICIRWSLQNNVVTIPKSTKKSRIQENFQVFDFQLDEDDMSTLRGLHDGRHVSWDPTHVD